MFPLASKAEAFPRWDGECVWGVIGCTLPNGRNIVTDQNEIWLSERRCL